MRAFWKRITAWLDYWIPDTDQLGTPENDAAVRQRLNANRTSSPLHRRAK